MVEKVSSLVLEHSRHIKIKTYRSAPYIQDAMRYDPLGITEIELVEWLSCENL